MVQDDAVNGNILELLTRGWEILRPHLVRRRFEGETGTFQGQVAYPEDAVREAFYNAVAHRDYSSEGRNIECYLYNDRLEMRSPGAVLSTINLSDLKRPTGVHDSRNANVARVLRELGYMREMGEGMRRIHALMAESELEAPDIVATEDGFEITFSQRNICTSEEQRWLDAFSDFSLSRDEKLVVLLGRGGQLISPDKIWQALDLVDTEEYRSILEGLQVKGLISSQISRSAAGSKARKQSVSPREIPRFLIRSPSLVQRDQREIVDAVISLGDQPQITAEQLRSLASGLSDKNPYQNRDVRVASLLRWLSLLDSDRKPTKRLKDLWFQTMQPLVAGGGLGAVASLEPLRDIYVGNLEYAATIDEVRSLFEKFGSVVSITMPMDFNTGQNQGYAFVRMDDMTAARQSVSSLATREFRVRREVASIGV